MARGKTKAIKMQPIESESIESLGYDAASKTLHVQFRNGGKYKHLNVSRKDYDALMAADSKGSHFSHHIRGSHKFERVA
ncbi:MAG: KTSC domain-containing protein [Acidobacteria bacterium]|nr:KTSC domain-containing protein [Acidobacteriota bacterium]